MGGKPRKKPTRRTREETQADALKYGMVVVAETVQSNAAVQATELALGFAELAQGSAIKGGRRERAHVIGMCRALLTSVILQLRDATPEEKPKPAKPAP